MKKSLLLAGISGFLCFANAQTASQKVMDGSPSDWKLPLQELDAGTHIRYEWTNDLNAFYICLMIEDEKTQMRMMHQGFSIAVDKKGKKNLDNQLAYKPEMMPFPVNAKISDPFEKEKLLFKSIPMIVAIHGFKSKPDGEYDKDSLKNIQLAIDWDTSKVMTLEYKIPFTELGYSLDSTKPVTIGIYLPAMPAPDMPSGNNGMSNNVGMGGQTGIGQPSGIGGQGMGSQAMGGASPAMGPPSGDMADIFQEKKFWFKFKPKGQ